MAMLWRARTRTPEEAGCPIRDDSWSRWLKMRDGSTIWFDEVVSWDGDWIEVTYFDDTNGHGSVGNQAIGDTVGKWINCTFPLRATSIRWSEVVAHGEAGS